MPQNEPKNKLLNRVFAILFFIYILVFFYYTVYGEGSFLKPMLELIHKPLFVIILLLFFNGIGFSIILFGLLKEIHKPSLDFTFHRNRKWISMSIILFAVFVFLNIWWWIAIGIPDLLPNRGWQATVLEYLGAIVASDTCILSLMLGILFLTNSNPKKSPSYKTILIGVVFWQVMCLLNYLFNAVINIVGFQMPLQAFRYTNFIGYTIFQPWFWCDITYLIVTLIGALWLLRTNTKIRKLIIIIILFWIIGFPLTGFILKLVTGTPLPPFFQPP